MPVTLAVHAARECLWAVPGEHPGDVAFASTTAPFAEPQNASIVARALRLSAGVTSEDFAGSTRAGLRALALALEAGDAGQRLIVAADNRHAKPGSAQAMSYGAGGAAILTGGHDAYDGRYIQVFRFVDGSVKSFEEYYDTALLNSRYGGRRGAPGRGRQARWQPRFDAPPQRRRRTRQNFTVASTP